jgi:hypothetical protein
MALIGTTPLHLPAYTGAQPAVLTITCECRRRYVVLTGVADAGAQLVRQEAERRGARFVDARVEPFVLCDCGLSLDLAAGDVAGLVM